MVAKILLGYNGLVIGTVVGLLVGILLANPGVLNNILGGQFPQFGATGPIGLWRLDEGSGSIASDSSGNGNNGTLNNAIWIDGKFEKALRFNGADSIVSVNDSNSLEPQQITVAFWFRRRGNQVDFAKLIWKGNNSASPFGSYGFEFNQDRERDVEWHIGFSNGNYTRLYTGSVISDNTWYHIAGTFNGTTTKLYLNGNEIASEIASGNSIIYDSIGLGIGDRFQTGRPFDGDIDEVAIWNRVLSITEIQQVYNNNSIVTPPPGGGTVCGNGVCESGETTASCSQDCPPPTSSGPINVSFQKGDGGSYSETDDTYIRSGSSTRETTNYGSSTILRVDATDCGGNSGFCKALIMFPNIIGGSSGQIKSGSTVLNATLELSVSNSGGQQDIYQLDESWEESSVTWDSFAEPGFPKAKSLATSFTPDQTQIWSVDITTIVQNWVNGEANYGILINSTSGSSVEYDSSESSDPPKLIVNYLSS